MAITYGNRKLLDLKRWEMLGTVPTNGNLTAGMCFVYSRNGVKPHMYFHSNNGSNNWMYDPFENGWVFLPAAGLANFGAGSCGVCHYWSTASSVGVYSLSATSGTVSSITTDQYLARNLSGFSVMILSGNQAGSVIPMTGNTLGPSATIYVSSQALTFDNNTRFRLLTPRFYAFSPGAQINLTSFRVYDYACNSWLGLATHNVSWATEGALAATPSFIDNAEMPFLSFNPTAGGSFTVTAAGVNWATNQWVNSQIRVASGTASGQLATITANTSNTLTFSSITSSLQTWNLNADSTSRINIDGNDDNLYLIGNGASAMYRYRISENRWETVTPVTARGGTVPGGGSLHWVFEVPDSSWTNTNAIKNGRYLYSFRGGATNILDIYDIPANTWLNNTIYSPAYAGSVSTTSENIADTGSKYEYNRNYIYIQKTNSSRFFRLDLVKNELEGWDQLFYPQSTVVSGNTMFIVDFIEGTTKIKYLYFGGNNTAPLFRTLII